MRFTPFIAVLLVPALASAANLTDIHRLARDQDASFAAARQAYLAGLEKLPQGKAGILPTVTVSGNWSQTHLDSVAGSGNYTPYGYTLSLIQPLYNPANWAGYEQGRLLAEQARVQLRQAEQDLILRTAQAYADVLKAESALNFSQAQKNAIAEQLAQAKKSFEVGAATITDTHEAQARFDLTTAQVIEAENTLEVKRRALEKLIQRPAPALAAWSAAAVARVPSRAQVDWVKEAEASGLGVLMAQISEAYAQQGADKVKADYRPKVNLSASYADTRNSTPLSTGQNGTLGVALSWALYEGGRTDSFSREAAASLQKAHLDSEEQRRAAALAAREAYLGVVAGVSRLKALDAAVRSSELQLSSTKLGLEVGVRTRVDVLNAQQQLFSAQKDLDAARYDWLLARLKLEAAVGQLTPDGLAEVDKLLQ